MLPSSNFEDDIATVTLLSEVSCGLNDIWIFYRRKILSRTYRWPLNHIALAEHWKNSDQRTEDLPARALAFQLGEEPGLESIDLNYSILLGCIFGVQNRAEIKDGVHVRNKHRGRQAITVTCPGDRDGEEGMALKEPYIVGQTLYS